jgi:DNA anti-recombination protein RmuC
MEPQITPEYIKQLVYSILPEVLAQYQEEKGKDFYLNPLLERLIHLEEELKALRIEMNLRFEAQRKESDAKFEAMNARFEALTKEMNARFEAQKQESDAKFEAINARFETLIKEMNARFEALTKEMDTRFEALDKRLTFLQWLIGIGIAFLGGLITLLNFLK